MRKKFLYGAMCVALASALMGCGDNKTSTSDNNITTAQSSQAENESDNISGFGEEASEDTDSDNSANYEDVASMSYDDAAAYLDTLPETNAADFTVIDSAHDSRGYLQEGECSIQSYNGSDTILIIPSEINGAKVVSVEASAFFDNKTIVAVKLPDTTRVLRESAFLNCSSLSIVTGLDNIQELENQCLGTGTTTRLKFTDSVTKTANLPFSWDVSVQVKEGSILADGWPDDFDITTY